MNITDKVIITDTNIITDLSVAGVLSDFVELDNVYISDMVKNDEINELTGDISIIEKFKVVSSTSEQLIEINKLSIKEKGLSMYDLINFVLARDYNYILATGDNRLRNFVLNKGIEVIRTLKIITLLYKREIITLTKAINALELLKQDKNTRIPKTDIDNALNDIRQEIVS